MEDFAPACFVIEDICFGERRIRLLEGVEEVKRENPVEVLADVSPDRAIT